MPDGGPLQMLFGQSAQSEADQQQARHQQVSALSQLLDPPDVTLDAKQAIATHLEDLMNVPSKNKGLIPIITSIFHHQQQTQQPPAWQVPELYGNRNARVPDVAASPDFGYQPAANPVGPNILTETGTPPSPEGQRRGSMTPADLAARRQATFEAQKQSDMQDRQDFLVKSRGEEARKLQQMKGDQAFTRLSTRDDSRMALLHEGEKLRAQRRTAELAAAYPDATPDQIAEKVQGEIQATQDQKAARTAFLTAQTLAIPQATAIKWANLDQTALRNDIYRTATGNAADKEAQRQAVEPMLDELKSVQRSIEYLSKFPAGTPQAAQLTQEQAHKAGVLNEIWKVNSQTTPQQPTSTVPQRIGVPVKPKKDPLGIFQ